MQSGRHRSNGLSRKVLVSSALGVSAVIVWLTAACLHGRASAGPAQAESNSSGSAPRNPLRPAGTEDTSSPPQKSTQSHPAVGPGSVASATVSSPAEKTDEAASSAPEKIAEAPAAELSAAGQHPLDPALVVAERVQKHIRKDIKDYTCVVVKQERISGTLNPPEYMAAKIRQKPFSVYLKFLAPEVEKDREVIYVAGANDGNLIAREGKGLKRAIGFVLLKPTSLLAMQDNRYPITELGIGNLIDRLIEVGEHDRKYGEVEVHFFKNAKVNGRVCTLIESVHPVPRRNFSFHKARIYIDDELQVPIRYEAYQWPKRSGDEPLLDESYTYLNLKLNVDLTDADFDYRSGQYRFIDK